MIPVYIITGQLDSGKTSFIQSTLFEQDWWQDTSTLYLQCEEGEYELAADYVRRKKITILPVEEEDAFSKEFCERITKENRPEQIVIEFNGMWNLQEFLKRDFPDDWGLAGIYSTVDGTTLDTYMTNMRNLFMNQLIESDLIVVNRCAPDLNRVTFRKAIKLQDPTAQLIFEGLDGKIIEFGEEDLPYDIKSEAFTVEDTDYGTWYADAMENPQRYLRKKITFLCQLFRPFGMSRSMFIPGRLVMACCPADVKFYGIPCKSDKAFRFENKSWHRITVEFGADRKKDFRTGSIQETPILHLLSIEDAPAPADEVVTL